MNEILEKRSARARTPRASATPRSTHTAPATARQVSPDSELFRDIGKILHCASSTDEKHPYSGESDRLLAIATMLAFTASRENGSTEEAYDIIACINAARLVPGDVESLERTTHIEAAAGKLAILLEAEPGQVLRTGVQRPHHPQEGKRTNDFTPAQLRELYRQACLHMECASYVLASRAKATPDSSIVAARDLLDAFCEVAQARLDSEEVGDLLTGDLPDISRDLEIALALLECLAVMNDDGVLHGVTHLLRCAQRIADGNLGVLE